MLDRINILKIIYGHLRTLRSLKQKSNKVYWADVILFFGIPIGISITLMIFKIDFSEQTSNLITAVSILGGFLFNLLAIIYSVLDQLKRDAVGNDLKQIFVKEIHINISYGILLSIISAVFLVVYDFGTCYPYKFNWLKDLMLVLNYFLLIHFLLTLLMILNRIYILMTKEANEN